MGCESWTASELITCTSSLVGMRRNLRLRKGEEMGPSLHTHTHTHAHTAQDRDASWNEELRLREGKRRVQAGQRRCVHTRAHAHTHSLSETAQDRDASFWHNGVVTFQPGCRTSPRCEDQHGGRAKSDHAVQWCPGVIITQPSSPVVSKTLNL